MSSKAYKVNGQLANGADGISQLAFIEAHWMLAMVYYDLVAQKENIMAGDPLEERPKCSFLNVTGILVCAILPIAWSAFEIDEYEIDYKTGNFSKTIDVLTAIFFDGLQVTYTAIGIFMIYSLVEITRVMS